MTDREKIYELSEAICRGCKTRHDCNTENCAMSEIVAEYLFNVGYRKMDEVTLRLDLGDRTAEEIKQIAEAFNGEIKKQVAKEVLQKAFESMKGISAKTDCLLDDESVYEDSSLVNVLNLIGKPYGVEVDEK